MENFIYFCKLTFAILIISGVVGAVSAKPTTLPSTFPTTSPSPSPSPTSNPSYPPSFPPPSPFPSFSPSTPPTILPSQSPTQPPSVLPTFVPSPDPSFAPTYTPSQTPTFAPSLVPTQIPSLAPTRYPTNLPTRSPLIIYYYAYDTTRPPTRAPSQSPTRSPTTVPTTSPTYRPTSSPTQRPTSIPTFAPVVTVSIVRYDIQLVISNISSSIFVINSPATTALSNAIIFVYKSFSIPVQSATVNAAINVNAQRLIYEHFSFQNSATSVYCTLSISLEGSGFQSISALTAAVKMNLETSISSGLILEYLRQSGVDDLGSASFVSLESFSLQSVLTPSAAPTQAGQALRLQGQQTSEIYIIIGSIVGCILIISALIGGAFYLCKPLLASTLSRSLQSTTVPQLEPPTSIEFLRTDDREALVKSSADDFTTTRPPIRLKGRAKQLQLCEIPVEVL